LKEEKVCGKLSPQRIFPGIEGNLPISFPPKFGRAVKKLANNPWRDHPSNRPSNQPPNNFQEVIPRKS